MPKKSKREKKLQAEKIIEQTAPANLATSLPSTSAVEKTNVSPVISEEFTEVKFLGENGFVYFTMNSFRCRLLTLCMLYHNQRYR